ncbi:uncharacterized protein LOC129752331 [Uranotaenia lowii]|uniref:uncharacterized protein LOC129752331 n=1 Tax=Uranotaenia lowii TaxID=190385 RepID=UPI002479D4DC|nr:uncharacterized protein LOC129752331 [Uranotaenia lowii]XP_055604093.1 uncharacterized protein LOC129752331 [Uranotaenia lowii]
MTNQFNPHEEARTMKTVPPNCQKLTSTEEASTRNQQQQRWNRAIPESDYIQLGTLRYGVRLSDSSLPSANGTMTGDGVVRHRGGSTDETKYSKRVSNSSSSCEYHTNGNCKVSSGAGSTTSGGSANRSCCCISTSGIEMPWTGSSYVRSRLPMPSSFAKNRKSSPSTSTSSSSSAGSGGGGSSLSSRSTGHHHQQLHQNQKQSGGPQQGSRPTTTTTLLQFNNGTSQTVAPQNQNRDRVDKNDYGDEKRDELRESSPASSLTVCCYSNHFGSKSVANNDGNSLIKVNNKYLDNKKLKKVNNNKTNGNSNNPKSSSVINEGGKSGGRENKLESTVEDGKWSNSFEYGVVKSGDFSSLTSGKETLIGIGAGNVKQTDGDDLNLKFINAQHSNHEPRLKDVNINYFKKKNISCDVYFGLDSSVGRTRNNNKNNIGKNTSTTGDDVCADELSSSSSLSPRSPSPLPLPPPPSTILAAADDSPWMLFDDCVRQPTPPCSEGKSFSCAIETSGGQLDSPTNQTQPQRRLRTLSDSIANHATHDIGLANANKSGRSLSDYKHNTEDLPNFAHQRKSSLPVINHTNVNRSHLYRKLATDSATSTKTSLRPDSFANSVVICHLTPKLHPKGSSHDHSTAETRLKSLNRYCARNLSPNFNPPDPAEIEDFSFIDSSDISSTGDDIITVINEEDYHEYQNFPPIPINHNNPSKENSHPSGCVAADNHQKKIPTSVCDGDESAANGCADETKPSFPAIKYKKNSVTNLNPALCIRGGNRENSERKVRLRPSSLSDSNNNNRNNPNNSPKSVLPKRPTSELKKLNTSSNNSRDCDGETANGLDEATSSPSPNGGSQYSQLKFNNISPDNSSSSLNCFGKNQLHARDTANDKPIMEKRNNTLDRLQKLVKKTTSGSNEKNPADKHSGTKTERLRELTELLKGNRTPPVPPPRRPKHSHSVDKSFERPCNSSSLLNINTLSSEEGCSNLLKTKESRSIDIPYQFVESNRSSTPSSPLSEHKSALRANVSTSNLDCLHNSTKETGFVEEVRDEKPPNEVDEIFTKLPRPESRSIVGSYTQKTIPFRSASFSQVDYSSGKYIRSALGALKNSLMRSKDSSGSDSVTLPRNKKEFTRSCSPVPLSTVSEPDMPLEENEISSLTLKKTELSISLVPPDVYDRIDCFDGRELSSNRNSDIETIVEDPEAEHIENIENQNLEQRKAEICVVQASQMELEPLVEEGIPITPQALTKDEECLQQATTCLIPVPVYDCVVSEWSTARPSEQWIDASVTDCERLTDCLEEPSDVSTQLPEQKETPANDAEELFIENPPHVIEPDVAKLEPVDEAEESLLEPASETMICTPPVSIICTEPDCLVSTTIVETPPTPDEQSPTRDSEFVEIVEVRKRHSNNDENGETVSNCNSEIEEKRRMDKFKRRKGIYIQWPAIDTHIDPESDSNDNCPLDNNWRRNRLTIEKDSSLDLSGDSFTDLSSKDITSSPEKCKDLDIHQADPFLLDPNTPDSDIVKPMWPKSSRRQSLTYQSSDEKDDATAMSSMPVRSFKNIFLRSDSVSDNESDRASSRDRTSASPAPPNEHDLKRYSKRPLRGPYGQMLEAEMKKPSKVHYNEILEELCRHESSHSFPSFNRNRGSGSQSMDETNDRYTNKLFKPRKTNASLPLPSHSRTASSPSKLAELGSTESSPTSNSKRNLSNIEQRSTDSDKSDKSPSKQETKKFSLDSRLSEKCFNRNSDGHEKPTKRSSSGASDKHQKRSLDDSQYSQAASRTPSERSFVLNTPDTPKSLMASPELLAELLKGSSEKLITEQLTGGSGSSGSSNALPTAVLKCLDTRTHVVVELFNTEKSYVESLQTIVLKYLNQLKSPEHSGLVDTQTVDEIFFMVPTILNIHERFLEELRRRLDSWDPLQKIGDAFIDVFSRPVILDTYTSFVNNWNRAKDAIRATRQKCPAFARFLEAMAREHKGKLSLDNLLIKPVQKFPNYELILSRLIKHTDIDHPDQKPLQEALKLVHDILMFLNCKEKEALENDQRETALRELEGVIEGMNELVTSDRAFLLFDLVSMPSGQTRKERGFFLFNDLLVITSIKRRSGTIRKNNVTCLGSVASTLDTNKYKFLTKISLDDLEIVKSKDENVRRIMREIENLSEDSTKLLQISELAASLRCPHQLLEEAIRDLQREVQRQLSERQTNDAQLNILELTLNSSNGTQNMTVVFSKPDKRSQWEEVFTEAKQKLASTTERCQIPVFLCSVPIRKTRAGLQFTCASPTLGAQRDVWVCNSDGYVGQVCVLSLVPEPTVTSCNGVCNARILCVASVPASEDCSSSHRTNSINISVQDAIVQPNSYASNSVVNSSKSRDKKSSKSRSSNLEKNSSNIQLDSGSSSGESDTESHQDRAVSPSSEKASSTLAPTAISHRHQESNSEESDGQQSTMWLGTEDGCIHVYNCTDNIRIKKNKIKIPHTSAVYSILYLNNRVFVSLANGDVCVYSRDHNGWNTTTPITMSVGTVKSPVTKLLNVHGKLWCAIQGCIKVLNTTSLLEDSQIQISNDSKPITNMTVLNDFVWISVQNSAHIKCCHFESFEIIFEVNLAPSVNKMLSNCDDIIRQHKAACLRVTSLLACKDLIWVGTSAGVLLTIAASNVCKGSAMPAVTGIPHGHTGHVRFLTVVEPPVGEGKEGDSDKPIGGTGNSNMNKTEISAGNPSAGQPNLLVISGGDGYEDFRSSGTNTMSEIAGREDSTNHLLLWQV